MPPNNRALLCQCEGCEALANIRIGHTGLLIYMCHACQREFRASQVYRQRAMLAGRQEQRFVYVSATDFHKGQEWAA